MSTEIPYQGLTKESFERLFRAQYESLCRFAASYVKDADAAQEIVQEVFVNVWQKRETMDPAKELKTYLFTSVRNRSLNHLRDNRKYRSEFLDIELEAQEPVHEGLLSDYSETEKRIREAMQRLPERCRQVFELSRFEELKYREIAGRLGISVKTVEVQMSKALKILRDELKDLITAILIIFGLN